MSYDLQVGWLEVTQDKYGQPANTLGYKVWDMTDDQNPVEKADVPDLTATLVDFVADPDNAPPVAVCAYNAEGDGTRSDAVIADPPGPAVPAAVQGVTATILPKE